MMHSLLYMPYLMVGYALTDLVILACCLACTFSVPELRGVRALSWCYVLGFFALILLAVRPVAPLWLSATGSNALVFILNIQFNCAVAETVSVRRWFLRGLVPLAVVFTAGNWWFCYVHPNVMARVLLSGGFGAISCAVTVVLLYRARKAATDAALRLQIRVLKLFRVGMVAVLILRCVLTVMYPPQDFLHLDWVQALFTYLQFLTDLGSGFGLIWLAFCIHRKELEVLAQTDGLTGLLNRRAFEETLTRELRVGREGSLAVLLADIDHFKQINDEWGHPVGDEVIRRVGQAMREELRETDVLARHGGEEYVVLLRGASAAKAEEVAERLRAKIADLQGLPENARVTVSVGVAIWHVGDAPGEILRRCDVAMYRSKRAGRNLVTVYYPLLEPMHAAAQSAQALISG
jgi:diguanylate cyclase (GGDEF)-like protein